MEAEALLAKYVPLMRQLTGRDITLERMRPLMTALSNPHERLKIIHLAGTSGKSSTAYYIANMLTLTGHKTGLTVSPHIDNIAERVQINMQPLRESAFTDALSDYTRIVETGGIEPTYFELLVGFAYWYFDKAGVDYAVVETGLGGMDDSTNIASRPDKICVITDIGLDHMHVLGRTVPEIARQKAGIIHSGNTVFMYQQADEIMEVIEERCTEVGAELRLVQDDTGAPALQSLPGFQRRNWTLAKAVFEYVRERDGLPAVNSAQSIHAQIPARMDIVRLGGKSLVMDGAHNEQKMRAFATSFKEKYPDKKVPVLLSLKRGKEAVAVLPLLKTITSTLFVTAYRSGEDMPIAAIGPEELNAAAKQFGFASIVTEPDIDKAYGQFISNVSELGVVTGSFYLIGQLRHNHPELLG